MNLQEEDPHYYIFKEVPFCKSNVWRHHICCISSHHAASVDLIQVLNKQSVFEKYIIEHLTQTVSLRKLLSWVILIFYLDLLLTGTANSDGLRLWPGSDRLLLSWDSFTETRELISILLKLKSPVSGLLGGSESNSNPAGSGWPSISNIITTETWMMLEIAH